MPHFQALLSGSGKQTIQMAMVPGHWAIHSLAVMPSLTNCRPAYLFPLQAAGLWVHPSEEPVLDQPCSALAFEHP